MDLKSQHWVEREPKICQCWGLLGRGDHGQNHGPSTRILGPISDMVFRDEGDFRRHGGDENPIETRCKTCVTEAVSTEPTIQGPCEC